MPVRRDKRGRYHVEFMQNRRRIHRVCPPDTPLSKAKEWETKLRQEVFRVDQLGGLPEYSLQQGIDRYINEYTGKDKAGVSGKCRQLAQFVVGHLLVDVVAVAGEVSKLSLIHI